jgi:hypothetical protein
MLLQTRERPAVPALEPATYRPPLEDAPIVALAGLLTALGVAVAGIADHLSRLNQPVATGLFWAGLLLCVLPPAATLAARRLSRAHTLTLLLTTTAALYLVYVMYDPTQLHSVDELMQLRGLRGTLATHRLFTRNPLVAAFSRFPGLDATTSALVQLTHVPVFAACFLLIGTVHLVGIAALYLLLERLLGASRPAAAGVFIYLVNPSYLFFDSQWSYESLALPLAVLCLLLVWTAGESIGRRWLLRTGAAIAVAVAVPFTHHMTAIALSVLLTAWTVLDTVRRPRARARTAALVAVTTVALLTTGLWLGFGAAGQLNEELRSPFGSMLRAIGRLFGGHSHVRRLFVSRPGLADPLVLRIFAYIAVLLLLNVLVIGLLGLRRARPRSALLIVVAIAGLAYPVSLAFRLFPAGVETSNRSSEFLFLALAVLAGLAAWAARPRELLPIRRIGPLLVTGLGILLVGGVVIGAATYTRLPIGSQLGGADGTVAPQTVAAGEWANRHLPAGANFTADTSTMYTIGGYSFLRPHGGTAGGVRVSELISSPRFTPADQVVIHVDRLDFVVIDNRLASQLPATGSYFNGSPAVSRPLPKQALSKFNRVPGSYRIYDSGRIIIYFVSRS